MDLIRELLLEASLDAELDVSFSDVAQDFGELDKLEPTLSTRNVNFHLNTLTKGYFDKVQDTKSPFALCGAKLHAIWWEQFNGEPGDIDGTVKILGYKDAALFINEVLETALQIQGNGWVVVTKDGITACPNHSWDNFDDIILLVDMWEHAYQADYGSDKKAYVERLLEDAISWEAISSRIEASDETS